MKKLGGAIDFFLNGSGWTARNARKSLPILVQEVERLAGLAERERPAFTYGQLAEAVGESSNARNIDKALGSIGNALKELSSLPEWKQRGPIPQIQLLVWSQGQKSPGDRAFGFFEMTKEQLAKLPRRAREDLAAAERRKILQYQHWREVLAEFNLKPRRHKLPSSTAIAAAPDADGCGRMESKYHRRLKHYVAANWSVLGLQGMYEGVTEEVLPSGDRTDVILRDNDSSHRVCVEVKSRISPSDDIIRGVFQCVKYKAVMDAEAKFQKSSSDNQKAWRTDVMLAVEADLSGDALIVSRLFDINVVRIRVPDEFEC